MKLKPTKMKTTMKQKHTYINTQIKQPNIKTKTTTMNIQKNNNRNEQCSLETVRIAAQGAQHETPPEKKQKESLLFQLAAMRSTSPHKPTQLHLARSHARTTRTRNETETNVPIDIS